MDRRPYYYINKVEGISPDHPVIAEHNYLFDEMEVKGVESGV